MNSPFAAHRGGQVLTSADRVAILRYPELARLIALRSGGGWFFQPVRVADELELVTGARRWPDRWSDALAIRARGDAKAFRCDPACEVVWEREGGLVEVIDGLLELPAPDAPKAPRLVKTRTPRIWVPGSSATASRRKLAGL